MINSESMIITTEVVSAVFMTVILCGSIFGNSGGDRVTRFFRCCLISTIIGAVLDAVSYVVDGKMENEILLILINMATYITWVLIVLIFAFYIISLVEKKVAVHGKVILPVAIITGLCVLLCIIGSFNGRLVYLEDGYFVEGPWGNLISFALCACTVYLYVILFIYRKALEFSSFIVIAAFLLFPFLDTIISIYLEIDYSYPILAVAFMVIYVVIQEKTVAEGFVRKKIFEETTYTDPLTREKNLRAYDEIIKADVRGGAKGMVHFKLSDGSAENTGRFAEVVRNCFEGADIFRTAEDEFEMIFYRRGEAAFKKKMSDFGDILREDGIGASFEYEYSEE
ncbi:MAG: hypothetical protein K6B14_02240 [Lachnospiraceae bacterium]|nr:hypothetical protein [Lachnospiraceae bacterium]